MSVCIRIGIKNIFAFKDKEDINNKNESSSESGVSLQKCGCALNSCPTLLSLFTAAETLAAYFMEYLTLNKIFNIRLTIMNGTTAPKSHTPVFKNAMIFCEQPLERPPSKTTELVIPINKKFNKTNDKAKAVFSLSIRKISVMSLVD